MNTFQKIGLLIVAILVVVYVKMAFFGSQDVIVDEPQAPTETQQPTEETTPKENTNKNKKDYVYVFFIAHNSKGEEVYRAVKREYVPEVDGTSRLKFALKSLVNGPSAKEKKLGVYTEVPAGTRLISVTETPSKVVINLSGEFELGGGTDGLYKRLFQLIKTTKRNSNLPIYLQLNGKQVEVIGGEGIMINQPLTEDFANE